MTHNYTPTQILKFIYRDLSLPEEIETQCLINTNQEWEKTYNELKAGFDELPKVQFFPRGRVVKSILQYSSYSQFEA